MGRGGYNGGSTVIGPGSDWFSKSEPLNPKKKKATSNNGTSAKKVTKAKNGTSAKKVAKARSKLVKYGNEATRRETGGTVGTSGRIVRRDDEAGLVVERTRGKERRILFPVNPK